MSAFRNTRKSPDQGRVCHRIELPEPKRRRRSRRGQAAHPAFVLEEPPKPVQAAPAPVEPPTASELAASLMRDGLDLSQIEEDLVARAIARLRAQASESSHGDPRRIDILERRLSKLSGMLDERDRLLETFMLSKGSQQDSGIASVYRVVQGIDEEEANAETKRSMMSSIFEANLVMQGKSASNGDSAL